MTHALALQEYLDFAYIAAVVLLVLPGRRSFADITASDPARETHAMVAQAIAILHNTNISVDERRRLMLKLASSRSCSCMVLSRECISSGAACLSAPRGPPIRR